MVSLIGQRVGLYTWDDNIGRSHTLTIKRTQGGVEFEETIESNDGWDGSSRGAYRTITVPADLDMLKKIARVLLNIVVYERKAVDQAGSDQWSEDAFESGVYV